MMAANTTANGPMDDGARKAAHDVLGVQIYPGTEIMADGTCSIRGVGGEDPRLTDTQCIVANVHLKHTGKYALIPQPSDDRNDPLNWSRTWKWLTMSSMALSTFNYAFSPLSLSPQVPYYMESFDSTLPEVINFIGVSVLVLGFTNFIWIPLSRGFGRRPVAIVTILITTASCIWRRRTTLSLGLLFFAESVRRRARHWALSSLPTLRSSMREASGWECISGLFGVDSW
jgi:hypothetical protein